MVGTEGFIFCFWGETPVGLFQDPFIEKAIDTLYMITEAGLDFDFDFEGRSYRISKNQSSDYISLWEDGAEQAFSSLEALTQGSEIAGKPFLKVIWDLPFADLI